MTHEQKQFVLTEIAKLLKKTSQNKLANRAGISPSYMSQIVNEKWSNIANKTWQEVALNLGIKLNTVWNTAETSTYLSFQELLKTAKKHRMSIGISGDAGYGKTEAYEGFVKKTKNAFLIQFDEYWTKKIALQNFMRKLGLDPNTLTTAEMSQDIIIQLKSLDDPIVIFDEMDKTKDSVMMFYISLYNKLDGHCAFAISGSPYFQKAVEKNARRDKRGYKEFYSRLGRKFIKPQAPTHADIELICNENGVFDKDEIYRIYKTSENDLRRVKREVLKLQELKAA